MSRLAPSVTHSLKRKLLLPALLIGVAFTGASIWGIYTSFQSQLGDQMHERAELVANVVNYAAESVSRPGELQRIVSAISADKDVNLIVVVGGRPARILATSRNAWQGKALAELPDKDVREDLEKAIQTRQSESHLHKATGLFDFVSPLLLSQAQLVNRSLTDGAVIVLMDARARQAAIWKLTITFSLAFLLAGGLLATLGYALIRYYILHPVARIGQRVAHWREGAHEDWTETQTDDELGALAHTLKDALMRIDVTLQELRDQKIALTQSKAQIQDYLTQLRSAFMSTVEVATTLSEMRDPYTTGHERRVGQLAAALGAELGLDAERQEGLRVAGYLHDIGKITIPAEILSKLGQLSAIELKLIQSHAQASYDVLKDVAFPWPVAQVALQHHERLDGSGYPQGLKGEAILLDARILAVADVVEAMSSHRPYRPGLGIDKALAEIERGRGTLYDPVAADACLKLFREQGYTLAASGAASGLLALRGTGRGLWGADIGQTISRLRDEWVK